MINPNLDNSLYQANIPDCKPSYPQFFPILMVNHESGSTFPLRYVDPATAGTSGRTGGAAITDEYVDSDPLAYTCVEKIKGLKVSESKVADYGGEDEAKYALAGGAQRTVQSMIDAAVATVASSNAVTAYSVTATLTAAKNLIAAVNSIRAKASRPVEICMTPSAWLILKDVASIQALLKSTPTVIGAVDQIAEIASIRLEYFASSCFAAKSLELNPAYGDTYIWIKEQCDPTVDARQQVQAGCTIVQDIEGTVPGSGVQMTYHFDDGCDCPVVRAKSLIVPKVPNPALICKVAVSALVDPTA